ncbi:MAG: hypothetical protein SOX32_10595 [Candidatus Choladocola sp.]|nr:hypothetical protein [Candidatus Choladocola sp.]
MNFLDKMERKWGRYAIHNLAAIIIALYAAGYVISLITPELLMYCTLLPNRILRGEVWRLVTWILVPPSSFDIFTIIMLYFYFSIGRALERTWGAFKFNVYIFSGMIFTVIGAFLLYFVGGRIGYFSTYYINMSIFLAFALTYPDTEVLLYFLIPIKMKYMGLIYGFFIAISMIQGGWADRVSVFASLLNFVIFFLMTRKLYRFTPKEVHRRQEFKKNVKKVQPKSETRHKCAICGRTEKDGDHLEFRFCSKCEGNYEYCQDHLFTHEHIRRH